ncbi:hypothetical protein ACA910_019210 [Epithemia clementina (nom. ined.)]
MISNENASSSNFPILTDSGCDTMMISTPSPPSPPPRPTISSWNLYLIFLLIPDVMNNGIFGISTLAETITKAESNQRGMCNARILLTYFYLPANLYANAVVAREMYRLASASYRRQRIHPPKLRTVIGQMMTVYLWSFLLALWNIINVSWSPSHYDSSNDFCIRASGSPSNRNDPDASPTISPTLGSLISLTVNLVPICYVFYVGFCIWRGHLLPIKGRTRALAMYFFRVVLVFGIFFVPMLILWAALQSVLEDGAADKSKDEEKSSESKTLEFVLYCLIRILAPLQLFVTLRLAMIKDDVANAIHEGTKVLLCWNNNRPEVTPPTTTTTTFGGDRNHNKNDEDTTITPIVRQRQSSFFPRTSIVATYPPGGGGDDEDNNNDNTDEVGEWDADDVYDEDLDDDDDDNDHRNQKHDNNHDDEEAQSDDTTTDNTTSVVCLDAVPPVTAHAAEKLSLQQIAEDESQIMRYQPPQPPQGAPCGEVDYDHNDRDHDPRK